jgi:hypothetical protein
VLNDCMLSYRKHVNTRTIQVDCAGLVSDPCGWTVTAAQEYSEGKAMEGSTVQRNTGILQVCDDGMLP